MGLRGDKRQKTQLQMVLAFACGEKGEARRADKEGTESSLAANGTENPAKETA